MPRNLRIITGGRDRPTKDSPATPVVEPPVRIPLPPDGLTVEETDCFVVTARKLASLRVLSELDTDLLTIYCRNKVLSDESTERLKAGGIVLVAEGSKGQRRLIENPYLKIRNHADAVCLRIACEFGLTPSSRNRVSE
jgi:P27 family predicted phage terminase small subunit